MVADATAVGAGRLPAPGRRPCASADALLVVMGDVEMGGGGATDDFPHSDFLGEVVASYNRGAARDLPVDLVFNGDTFDLLKTPSRDAFPRHVTAAVALDKLAQVAAAHGPFFAGVREFLAHPRAERRVHFVVGNHDAELLFPEVQERVRALCGGGPAVLFPGFRAALGKVLIEHGSQADHMFRMDEAQPFVEFGGERVLHLSWGAAALLETIIPLKGLLGFHDRLKPKQLLLDLVPEIRELLVDRFWSYWLRDFWRGYFRGSDPTKEVTWTMLKEVVWRLTSKNAEVLVHDDLAQRLAQSDEFQLYVVGHRHEARWTSFGDRKILQAGCLRNEYMLGPRGESVRPIPKCWVEAWLREGVPVVSTFVEQEGPPAPEGYVPASIFDVVPAVRALAAPASRAAQEDQERREREGR